MTGIAQAFFMGYGQGGEWTPASLFAASEQGAWYDPSDLTTMWTDNGTTQAGVGDLVYRIDDKSGNGNHAYQTTEASRPTLRQDGSGNYYLDFDGTDDYMETGILSGPVMSGTGGMMAVAHSSDTDETVKSSFTEQASTATQRRTTIYADTRAATKRVLNYAPSGVDGYVNRTADAAPDDIEVIVGYHDATTFYGRLNGSEEGTTAESDKTYTGNLTLILGTWVTFYLDGKVFGAIALDREPTATEIANVETYLAGKSGATLA